MKLCHTLIDMCNEIVKLYIIERCSLLIFYYLKCFKYICVSEVNIIFPYLLKGRLAEEHEFIKILKPYSYAWVVHWTLNIPCSSD